MKRTYITLCPENGMHYSRYSNGKKYPAEIGKTIYRTNPLEDEKFLSFETITAVLNRSGGTYHDHRLFLVEPGGQIKVDKDPSELHKITILSDSIKLIKEISPRKLLRNKEFLKDLNPHKMAKFLISNPELVETEGHRFVCGDPMDFYYEICHHKEIVKTIFKINPTLFSGDVLVQILEDNPDFLDYNHLDKMDQLTIAKLCVEYPEMKKDLQYPIKDNKIISELLIQGESIETFDLSTLDRDNIYEILLNRPNLVKKNLLNLALLSDEDIVDCIHETPELADLLDLSLLSERKAISTLLDFMPSLYKEVDTSVLKNSTLFNLLKRCPEAGKTMDLSILNSYQIFKLLEGNPEMIDVLHCYLNILSPQRICWILSFYPDLINYFPPEKLEGMSPDDILYLLERYPYLNVYFYKRDINGKETK